jgi:hypothetical protein
MILAPLGCIPIRVFLMGTQQSGARTILWRTS